MFSDGLKLLMVIYDVNSGKGCPAVHDCLLNTGFPVLSKELSLIFKRGSPYVSLFLINCGRS